MSYITLKAGNLQIAKKRCRYDGLTRTLYYFFNSLVGLQDTEDSAWTETPAHDVFFRFSATRTNTNVELGLYFFSQTE